MLLNIFFFPFPFYHGKTMLICLLSLLIISNAVTSRRDQAILFSRVVILGLSITSFIVMDNLYIQPLEKGIGLYGGLFNITSFTQTLNIFILLISAVILTFTAFYPRKIYNEKFSSLYSIFSGKNVFSFSRTDLYNTNLILNKTGENFRIIEYALVIVFIICGSIFLMSSADLISLFLSIELQSYGLYILSTLYRDSESATASGLTYFLLGGLSSCFILLASALLYVNSGTTNLDNLYVISNISANDIDFHHMSLYQPYYLHMSLIIMSVGLLFKVSAAPFHFWSPDVYDGIPTIVTTFVAIVAKISIFAFFLELVYYTEFYYAHLSFSWNNILLFSSLLSLVIGSVLGLTQFRIKRLFAYSTISHVGFILLALSINSTESIQSYIFYILQYSLANLNAFIILVTIGYSFYLYVYKDNEDNHKLIDRNHSPIQLITQIKGYFQINPFIAISLAITIFSFVGIPPMIGFFAKQMVLSAALDSGYIFMSFVGILTSVIGAAYYLSLIKQIFFYPHDYKVNPFAQSMNKNLDQSQTNTTKFHENHVVISGSFSSSISIITLLLVAFIYMPGEWFNVVSILTIALFQS